MNLFLLTFGSVGVGVVLYSLRHAPEGFQSPDGFYVGPRPKERLERRSRGRRRELGVHREHLPVAAPRTAAPEYSEP
ncbi:MAG: hypothetical protein NTV51_01740 [Verrucomicrobia bacterium]|nr:hypothetical protein [Verrucomicrobiota bacterium]